MSPEQRKLKDLGYTGGYVRNVNFKRIFNIGTSTATQATVLASINKIPNVPIVIDSGAAANCISKDFYDNLNRHNHGKYIPLSPPPSELTAAGGSSLTCAGVAQLFFYLAGGKTIHTSVYVIDGLQQDCILGHPTLNEHQIDIMNSLDCLQYTNRDNAVTRVPFYTSTIEPQILFLREDVTLLPQTECLVDVGYKKETSVYGATSDIHIDKRKGLLTKYGCLAAKGINTIRQGNTNVVLANFGVREIHLKKGTPVATASPFNPKEYAILTPSNEKLALGINAVLKDIENNKYKDLPPDIQIGNELTKEQQAALLDLVNQYKDLFSEQTSITDKFEHEINTGDSLPVSCAPRRVSPHQRHIIKEKIQELLAAGLISPSQSPWSSPVVLVTKKDGDARFAIDYRKVNEVTKKDVYALPRVDDTLDAISGCIWFSTLDLASGYWQVPLKHVSREKTAFVTHEGLFEFNVLPFGLCNAPATFQRMMDTILAGLKWSCTLVYLDDIIIYSATFDQHLKDLAAVFDRLREANLKLKAKKCHLCCEEVPYLGYVITREGLQANPDKVRQIQEWPRPTSKKEVQSFLGLAGYYRKLIKDFAAKEHALRSIVKDDIEFHWAEEQDQAFRKLKDTLTRQPVLKLPDFSRQFQFQVTTDASDIALGAVLSQKDEEGKERVIQYASKILSPNEKKFHTQEKEALAIVWALEHFRPYLVGDHFTIHTDHQSLQNLYKADKGRLARWAMSLSDYDFTIKYKPGKANANADALSRTHLPYSDIPFDPEHPPRSILSIKENDIKALVLQAQKYDISIQQKDPGWLKTHRNAEWLEEAGLLLRSIQQGSREYRQILIPTEEKTLQRRLLYLAHDVPESGHLGREKTYNRLRERYFWPTMYRDTKLYIRDCLACRKRKTTKPNKEQIPLRPSEPIAPNFRVGIDLVGPLPKSTRKNVYILVMTDYFTKWSEAVPIRNKRASTVADALYKYWYCVYGIPTEIRSDQGKEFTNTLLQRLHTRLQVRHCVTTTYYPQANGQVERFNRTLVNSISHYVDQNLATWDSYLPSVLFAYRTAINDVTHHSPYQLMFGRQPKLPLDIIEGSKEDIVDDYEQYNTRLTMSLRQAHEITKRLIGEANRKTKARWDSKVHDHRQYKVGDSVLLHAPHLTSAPTVEHSKKFDSKWDGPYIVISIHPDNNDVYTIKKENTTKTLTVNGSKLAPWKSTPQSSTYPTSLDTLDSGTRAQPSTRIDPPVAVNAATPSPSRERTTRKERQLEAQRQNLRYKNKRQDWQEAPLKKILNHKREKGNRMSYLVEWENPTVAPTWVLSKDIFSDECLQEYWNKKREEGNTADENIPRPFRKRLRLTLKVSNNSQ